MVTEALIERSRLPGLITDECGDQESPVVLCSSLRKTAYISRCLHWFPHEMSSEERAQKFHSVDAVSTQILPRSSRLLIG